MQKAQGIFKVGLCQIKTVADKQLNLYRAEEMIRVRTTILNVLGSCLQWRRFNRTPRDV